jgi:hypothetical protein
MVMKEMLRHNQKKIFLSFTTISVLRRMRWAGHVARMGEKWNAYSILMEKTEGKRPLGRPKRKWVENIKMDLRYDGMMWTGMTCFRIGTSEGLL